MKTLSTLLLVFVPFSAYAGDCQRSFPILGFSGEEMHFQVTSGGKQTNSVVGVYSESNLIRTIVTRPDGAFTVDGLTEGKYWVYINGSKITMFEVKPLVGRFTLQLQSHLCVGDAGI